MEERSVNSSFSLSQLINFGVREQPILVFKEEAGREIDTETWGRRERMLSLSSTLLSIHWHFVTYYLSTDSMRSVSPDKSKKKKKKSSFFMRTGMSFRAAVAHR